MAWMERRVHGPMPQVQQGHDFHERMLRAGKSAAAEINALMRKAEILDARKTAHARELGSELPTELRATSRAAWCENPQAVKRWKAETAATASASSCMRRPEPKPLPLRSGCSGSGQAGG